VSVEQLCNIASNTSSHCSEARMNVASYEPSRQEAHVKTNRYKNANGTQTLQKASDTHYLQHTEAAKDGSAEWCFPHLRA
jgi:hypothetical protein